MLETVLNSLETIRYRRRIARIRHNERKELPISFPELSDLKDQLAKISDEYRSLHTHYTSRVSDVHNAVSLPQAGLLAWLVRTRPVRRILDTGSGFSTTVLRNEAIRKGGTLHYAVEDNELWLRRTTQFLREQNLPDENVFSWAQFRADASLKDFDLVFHDMGNMTTRILSLQELEPRLAADAWLVLDDMHKDSYSPHAQRHLGERWAIQSLTELTLDKCGRYACICRRKV